MGIKHSKLYKIFMESKDKVEKNISSIILDENLDFFTNDDIISLCNDEAYKNLFETKILVLYVGILYYRFTNEEYLNLFLNATSLLKQEMFYYLIKIYDKQLLIKIKETNKYNYLFKKYSSDIIVKQINNEEKNILELFDEETVKYFIKNNLKYLPLYYLKKFVSEIKNNYDYLEEVFRVIHYNNNFLDILNESSDTIYYSELKEKYKNEIYAALFNINIIDYKRSNYKNVLEQIVEEVLEMTNTKFEDIKYISEGTTSTAYKVGQLVIKTGIPRYSHEIPNHNRLLYPIIRRNLDDIYIEICDLVDTKNITEEDVYTVFKELMDAGIVWVDARKENLGRLLKDNNSYGIYINEETIGLKGKNEYFRKKGELVIIDTDLIYELNRVPWAQLEEENINLSPYYKLMDRYIKEKVQNENKHLK